MRAPLLTGLLLSFCLGCGSGGPFRYIAVEGSVTYEDGTPLPAKGIQLRFFALDAPDVEGAAPRPAIAHVDSEGKFELATSYKYGDGLIPGRHKVAILYAKDKDDRLLIPADYASTSRTPLVIDTNELPLEIKVPKP